MPPNKRCDLWWMCYCHHIVLACANRTMRPVTSQITARPPRPVSRDDDHHGAYIYRACAVAPPSGPSCMRQLVTQRVWVLQDTGSWTRGERENLCFHTALRLKMRAIVDVVFKSDIPHIFLSFSTSMLLPSTQFIFILIDAHTVRILSSMTLYGTLLCLVSYIFNFILMWIELCVLMSSNWVKWKENRSIKHVCDILTHLALWFI